MWIVIYVVSSLAALVALIALVGLLLPREHVATSSVRIAARPEDVWAAAYDRAAWPTWCEGVKAMERLPDRDGRAVWKMTSRHGALVTEDVEVAAPHRLVTHIVDETLPYGGRWIWEFEPSALGAAGTRVTITEDGWVRNLIFRTLGRFVFGYHATIEATLRSLAKKCGEASPQVERVR